ncbi:MAG: ATP-dependent Clp protease adapter ClpS [Planctomycetota bacterium]
MLPRALYSSTLVREDSPDPAEFSRVYASFWLGSTDPSTEEDAAVAVEERVDRLWNVIIWNDPINLMSYVTYVIQRLFGYSLEKATEHMLEVHNLGKSVVASVPREKGEFFVGRLHSFGLQATLERPS